MPVPVMIEYQENDTVLKYRATIWLIKHWKFRLLPVDLTSIACK